MLRQLEQMTTSKINERFFLENKESVSQLKSTKMDDADEQELRKTRLAEGYKEMPNTEDKMDDADKQDLIRRFREQTKKWKDKLESIKATIKMEDHAINYKKREIQSRDHVLSRVEVDFMLRQQIDTLSRMELQSPTVFEQPSMLIKLS